MIVMSWRPVRNGLKTCNDRLASFEKMFGVAEVQLATKTLCIAELEKTVF